MLGDFTLNSGAKSKWKIDCDSLTPGDIEALAEMIRHVVGPYSTVEGVPRGGLALAGALRPHANILGPHLLVDDVLTTGGSMRRLRDDRAKWPEHEGREIVGAVVFARGQCPLWVRPLFQMPEQLWLKARVRG